MTEEDRVETVANLLAISTLSQHLITFLDTEYHVDPLIERIVEQIIEALPTVKATDEQAVRWSDAIVSAQQKVRDALYEALATHRSMVNVTRLI